MFGPCRQRLRGERGGGLERFDHIDGAGDPGRSALAVEDLVVRGERAGVARRGGGATLGRSAFHQHERLHGGGGGEAIHQTAPVGDPFDVGEADGGRVVGGVPARGSRRRVTAAALPADTARLMPTPVIRDRLRNVDTKLPLWLATPIDPAGGYGATIWAHSETGVLTTP